MKDLISLTEIFISHRMRKFLLRLFAPESVNKVFRFRLKGGRGSQERKYKKKKKWESRERKEKLASKCEKALFSVTRTMA